MTSVAEFLASIDAAEQRRAAKRAAEPADAVARFYRSRAFAKAKYAWMKTLPRPLRCTCCGVTAADARLVCDHIEPLRKADGSLNPQGWAKRFGPFQLLCNEHNFICKGRQDDDWRDNVSATQPEQTNK
jgi:hypothetical protein